MSTMNKRERLYMTSVLIGMFSFTMTLVFLPQEAYAHGMSEADKQAIVEGGNLLYLWIGATHMLSGYDHLAFVFGIIFFLSGFRDIVKYVSAFTIGHSVTLIYATFNAVQLNYYFIDAIIGLSVCYIAFANIDGFRKYLSINPPNMMAMILGLGLIHGFGLSTRLQELPLSADSLLMNIISFNVGVELGQVTALAVMLALMAAWRKRRSFKAFSLIANYSLIIAGALLFLMQMHDYTHDGKKSVAYASEPVSAESANEVSEPSQDVSKDEVIIIIPARSELEYKVVLAKGAPLRFVWSAGETELFYDFHGEPKGDTTGSFKSYKSGTAINEDGSLVAPFAGTHGWYWKNNSNAPVTIRLALGGEYLLPTSKKVEESNEERPSHNSVF